MASKDPMDATMIDRDPETYTLNAKRSKLKGLKVGVITEYFGEDWETGVKERVDQTRTKQKKEGDEVPEMSIPTITVDFAFN